MRFGPKIFLVLVGLILTLVLITTGVASDQLGKTYAQTSFAAMQGAADVVRATLLDQDRRLHLLLRPLVNDARIRGRLSARNGLGQEDATELRQIGNDYFGSWMDEYLAVDRDHLPEQDLLLLIGKDGSVAWGSAGDVKQFELTDEVLGNQQVSKLIHSIPEGSDAARMLWSGPRLRTRAPIIPGLEHGLYFAEVNHVTYHTPGTGSDELAGVAVVASHRVDLTPLAAVGVDALFVDHGMVVESTFGRHDAGVEVTARLEAAAMAWLTEQADGGRPEVVLAGVPHFAQAFEPGAYLTPGPVSAGLFYSRERELDTVSAVRRTQAQLGGLLVLLAVASAVVLSRGLSKPIAQIAAAAGRVAGGDLQTEVPPLGRDELGDLARRFNQMVKGLREREIARGALSQYLSPEMAADLLKGEGKATLQGRRRELTILFCDVAGFTTISEQLEPEALVTMLNQYLDLMVKVLIKHGAYVDKFEGDAIMAFWNAPRDSENHAASACQAILQMRAAAVALSAEWKAGGQVAFTVRYGLHTGVAIVGNIGATDKLNYTAIGDNVNLASRLEGANKQYGTALLISETTREAAREEIEVRELDVVKVKGKARPVKIFELLAARGELTPEQARVRNRFEAGLKLYRERRFAEAREQFLAEKADAPSSIFAERCARFLEQPPGPEWDGTYEMVTK